MKVREIIEDLQQFDPDDEVGFCVGVGEDLEVLAIYKPTVGRAYRERDAEKVWFDLGLIEE